ncbi:DUF2087 domain-containing protein [Shewanella salipaludis]|uniref:DUF2087 domain-containing protein n=1 Tax=Shewanella salipaludis TaxID=2723052 RepID=A0A972FXC8_9GAMM|nr:DUF2087 domain-containing protein [Shewanella salipaludis]NMH64993.1 DUF2087 domain-containing protein [Shewanella salipaludis]
MTKQIIPFSCDDISALAKSLRKQLQSCDSFPSHVDMLNILAKATGYANFQQLRQATEAMSAAAEREQLDIAIPAKLKPFMTQDYILRAWPVKRALQDLSLWFFWCRFQYQQAYGESEVNEVIKGFLGFADFALIRRELCNHKLLKRTDDGRHYWRAAAKPPAELHLLADVWPGKEN